MESGGWLGVCPLLLAAYAWRRHVSEASVRSGARWACFFRVDSGSHAFILGQNTAFLIGDGLAAVTPSDHNPQTIHERPIVGGFVARLPPSVMAHFLANPLLSAWLRLSGASGAIVGATPLPDTGAAGSIRP